MNSTFKFKLIQALNKKNANKGFTLIELLVVVIIIGVLAAISLPNLLGQVGRARQAEARTNLGVVNRAQQVHRLENTTFATVMTDLPVTTTTTYYSAVALNAPGDATSAVHTAIAGSNYTNDIRDYSSAVGQTTAGVFSAVICETNDPTATVILATVSNGTVGTCPANSRQVGL
ncbi:MAG: prepilin-type N-terminal cleavage/methylation domain-containing protein [Microcystis aeruginosa Ma_MB_F_20061100_S20]|uniref:Prepilin-type N-terminal cleavage/methylation domain-containing protein n=1 Tax=Microcystis aeruginosa Ma_MB_F_20061100_S20D TaxID=2486253 RepID=A0A552EWG7_MICAE|nr:MAG: prepilin-type N-terminal cleavage/methylation domain-containing protein [Microcystis aeruginosa Ma_MB_F_20061100_S20]TRU38789.1 MAG: prepilin-type N-terminal cleavage/methylation domain-containing protein [Microcystis aeruginosa Ma_MB_F_20061100_S20D]